MCSPRVTLHPCSCNADWACRCNAHGMDMVHAGELSYYPKAGMLRKGRMLYCVRVRILDFGWCFWRDLVMMPPTVVSFRDVQSDPNRHRYTWTLHFLRHYPFDGLSLHVDFTFKGKTPVVHIWRIQRAMRRFLRRRFEQRSLAVLMGSHERLGCGCVFADLSHDLICQSILVHL